MHATLGTALLTALALAVPAATANAPKPPAGATAAAVTTCGTPILRGVLPRWARTGFSGPRPRMPHVIGRSGAIAAILFGDPLLAPPPRNRNNKILWVSRRSPRPGSPLRIRAQRMAGRRAVGRHVVRVVPGAPGPSIINLPVAGCWRLSLSWSGRYDSVDLRYARRGA